ncbi:unnamed protein product [Acanthoscelides obtectus]|uniref:Uncharacterized protein n=1 Tax=Acanthoscelides obtectus TaxID=200917 RepID=A0A9P0P3L3_ACAOB|nr:unnamed protein product [Acanthoscelides obtectus]CAK1658736.1 hypothetical protein AOBTE_LOCUS21094 [Acanthoscelides obtectus]
MKAKNTTSGGKFDCEVEYQASKNQDEEILGSKCLNIGKFGNNENKASSIPSPPHLVNRRDNHYSTEAARLDDGTTYHGGKKATVLRTMETSTGHGTTSHGGKRLRATSEGDDRTTGHGGSTAGRNAARANGNKTTGLRAMAGNDYGLHREATTGLRATSGGDYGPRRNYNGTERIGPTAGRNTAWANGDGTTSHGGKRLRATSEGDDRTTGHGGTTAGRNTAWANGNKTTDYEPWRKTTTGYIGRQRQDYGLQRDGTVYRGKS